MRFSFLQDRLITTFVIQTSAGTLFLENLIFNPKALRPSVWPRLAMERWD
jgi:hypothetical protein